jgi:hypothetical protein
MFKDKGERAAGQLAREVRVFRGMSIDYEATQRLDNMDNELTIASRHLLTSNDRCQFTAAHLLLAHNAYAVADTVATELSQPGALEGHRDVDPVMLDMLRDWYQTARAGLEKADLIHNTIGFKADSNELGVIDQIATKLSAINVPTHPQRPLFQNRAYVQATLTAVERIGDVISQRYRHATTSRLLDNVFRLQLEEQATPLLASITAQHNDIVRLNGGFLVDSKASPDVLQGTLHNAQTILTELNTLSLLLTVPRLIDDRFTLREPYDERRAQRKGFDASKFSGPAVSASVTRPAQPSPRPFDPNNLPPAQDSQAPKPFDSSRFTQPAQKDETQNASNPRPFDPNRYKK